MVFTTRATLACAKGARLLSELERVGVVSCCTRTGYRTARDALERARRPVVGINGLHIFLGRKEQLLEQFIRHIDYIAQLVSPGHLGLGLDFVHDQEELNRNLRVVRDIWLNGLGYEPGIAFHEPEALPTATEVLLSLGYTDAEVRGILAENFLSVAGEVGC